MKETLKHLKEMVEVDIKEIVSKGELCPEYYEPLGEAIDILKDIMKIETMQEEEMAVEGASERVPRMPYNSYYNANRSPRTGRYISNTGSYHDPDGSITADLNELLERTRDDHDRMLIMRIMDKLNEGH